MPSNLSVANVSPSSTVLPASLSTSFTLSSVFPTLSVSYHDGTVERSLITDTVNPARVLRVWVMSKRLTTAQLATLLTFWETTVQGGLKPFYFYDPWGVLAGHKIGSNYDATGAATQGRATVFFRGHWQQATLLGRHDVPNLELVEVA